MARKSSPADTLLRAVGKPRNINTVAVADLACVRGWLTAAPAARVVVVEDLTAALATVRASEAFADIRGSAWNIRYEFTVMVALGKAIDRLIRARLPLAEETLVELASIAVDRADFSVRYLATQLEAFRAAQPIGLELELAIAGVLEAYRWDAKLVKRLWKVIGPVATRRRDATETALITAIAGGDTDSVAIYADWLEAHGDRRGAAYLRAPDGMARILVPPAWRARLRR